ncbi:hypothetical protein [Rhizobium grahamii]|uniref:Uncharacterized protein n=1 Tax=Rhizobium grahamii CCGE 502 TaxID=990285 RepID=S3IBG2_9HYPH|nr:hypothetical protein [Rhizobium grahamii]EPE96568.1 hypothetical protein RGCCGE502_19410 [Rhizobium grahamii CCGE 502]
MSSVEQMKEFARLFDAQLPSSEGDADAYLEVDSFRMFAPTEEGDLFARLALSSSETIDLTVNPLCAARLAATILDLVGRSGDFVVDLPLYDARTGGQVARLRP